MIFEVLLVIWNVILTVLIVLLHFCQKNQEQLLYLLRNETNIRTNTYTQLGMKELPKEYKND